MKFYIPDFNLPKKFVLVNQFISAIRVNRKNKNIANQIWFTVITVKNYIISKSKLPVIILEVRFAINN